MRFLCVTKLKYGRHIDIFCKDKKPVRGQNFTVHTNISVVYRKKEGV